jgi:microcystin-dependent protein
LAATGISVLNAGNGGAHNNMQPYLGTNYIIRVL